ncbi:hypothetical protein EXS72_00610 [Candidatus Pacearchaeota archaeon]|nr:hypothetical protein [Candidatus Pacearchaeota archaeon]
MTRVRSMNLALIVTTIVVTLVTIFAELLSGFKDFLKSISGHHWTTKSWLSIILFFGIYFFVKLSDKNLDIQKETKKVILVILISMLLLFAFFIWHYFFA